MNLLVIAIAIAAAVLTYAVTFRVLKELSMFDSPRLIAVCVSLLSGLSLLWTDNGIATFVLLPYATLGLALLVLLVLKSLGRSGILRELERSLKEERSASPRRRRKGSPPPAQSNDHRSAHLREAPPSKE